LAVYGRIEDPCWGRRLRHVGTIYGPWSVVVEPTLPGSPDFIPAASFHSFRQTVLKISAGCSILGSSIDSVAWLGSFVTYSVAIIHGELLSIAVLPRTYSRTGHRASSPLHRIVMGTLAEEFWISTLYSSR
jgi:hypothetical protein